MRLSYRRSFFFKAKIPPFTADVKPMLEASQSAKNKQDAAWSRFLTLLEYKADLHGTHVVKVDPAGTTKECSRCGVDTDKPIWVREHSCPACGHEEDRDLNAAKNILLAVASS
jgi:putative transposase